MDPTPAVLGESRPAASVSLAAVASDGLSGAASAASVGDTGGSGARLACYACKRRKVKCNRQLPSCSLCRKSSAACQYPTHPEKPGPKTGSVHGSKRRRLDCSPTTPTQTESSPQDTLRSDGRPEDDLALSPSARPPNHHDPSNVPIFSRIMYPSHEAQTRPQSPSTVDTSPDRAPRASGITVDSVCERLGISRPIYDLLMGSYFDNMTAFSLFRPGSIEPKFAMMQYHSDAEALIAAMFSFSARHARDVSDTDIPSPAYFAQIASSKLDESVDRYGDLRPPFWLLQAGILVTFYQLTRSVRSRSWKKLGDCIRYAYDTNLHLVDANVNPDQEEHPDLDKWVLMEERRRAWWAVWEMDVFASTIRRLPTAIDPSLNLTKLPVSDACWFKRTYQPSCFLVEDCGARWKALARSGNQCAKAWFIVINSLMRNTQRLVYPAGSHQSLGTTNHDELSIMANCLYCTVTSLPSGLAYQGETLTFRGGFRADGTSPRQAHADLYSIHLMTQLCRFMIYHHKICARAPWLSRQKDKAPPQLSGEATSEWSNYISASDEIVSIVRSSARDHFRFVNPFLANTLWFAAAAQCACRVFGPPSFNKRLTGSNLDLLRLTIDRFIAFWDGMGNLGGKLARIETGLQNLMNKPGSDIRGNGDSLPTDLGHLPEQSTAAVPQPQTDAVPDGHGPAVQLSTAWPAPFIPEFQVGDVSTQTFALPGGGHGHDFFAAPLDFSPFGLEDFLMAGMDGQYL